MAEKTEFKTVETSQEDLEELEEKIRRHRHKIARRTALVIVTVVAAVIFVELWSALRTYSGFEVLGYLAEIAGEVLKDEELAAEAESFRQEVRNAIETLAVIKNEYYGRIYAYETDGYGQYLLMDDANVPSLLAMEYLGYEGDREVMENTRRFILSEGNPYYFKGKAAAGIGSPHVPPYYIWHIGLAIQGLTEASREEKLRLLQLMRDTDGGKGMMHEGFHVDDPAKYTRQWFSKI